MKAKLQRTFTPTPADVDRTWYVVDAEGIPLGRLASEVAQILRGKHKPTYAPHMDMGDYVIVVNAGKVSVSGADRSGCRQGDDPEEPTRPPDALEAQGLRRGRSSARGSEATTAHTHVRKG